MRPDTSNPPPSLPAPTLARLRAARHGAGQTHAAPARHWSWLLAAALGTAFGIHLLLRPALPPSMSAASVASAPTATAASAAAQGDTEDAVAGLLEENPDLYLWLGPDTSLAMEWTR